MKKLLSLAKHILRSAPLVLIFWASFFPMKIWAQQTLILFTLIWFNTFIMFEVIGK